MINADVIDEYEDYYFLFITQQLSFMCNLLLHLYCKIDQAKFSLISFFWL